MSEVTEKVEEVIEAVEEKAAEVKEAVEEKVEELKEKAPEILEEVKEVAAEVKEAATEKAAEIKEAVEEKVEEVKAKVSTPAEEGSMDDLGEALEKSLQAGPPKNDDPVWDKFEQMLADKTIFEVKIDSAVKGGVIAFVDEVRAFIPAGKLSTGYVENLEDYKGKKINVIVITAERDKKNLVLSGRDAAFIEKRAAKAEAIANIKVDDVLDGKVESLKDYGAFIDLGNGVSGLLHVAQISYKRVEKPADVLSVGQEVKVKVLRNEDGKLSLSMKALEEAPARAPREDRPERKPRRKDDAEHIDFTDKGSATTSMADLLSGIKL